MIEAHRRQVAPRRVAVEAASVAARCNALLCVAVLLLAGCERNPAPSPTASQKPTGQSAQRRSRAADVLLPGLVATLNDLASEVDTVLLPPEVILDGSKSADGKEVLATCSVTPQVPDGPYNYLAVPARNAGFRSLGVRAGDVVRYFVTYDEEALEHGYEQRTYLELIVRRLADDNSQNALIFEGGLTGPVVLPERIEIWRYSDKRMKEIHTRLQRYIKLRRPAVGWEPSPDESALLQLVERLNQWTRNQRSLEVDWQLEPLLETLPAELRQSETLAAELSPEALGEGSFESTAGRELQQAIWLRDIAAWASADGLKDVEIASALFDWTVRNIQLDEASERAIVHQPWQALMYGHGSAESRAWVFAELCRQQQLDVVMLTLAPGEGTNRRWWLPALLSEGQLYLFDTRLGLPIFGKQAGNVATLAELIAEPDVLRRLDLDEQHTYPILDDDLKDVGAELIATPLQLSRRSAQFQSMLEGTDQVELTADLRRVASDLADHPTIGKIGLWTLPFQSVLDEQQMKPTARRLAALRFVVFAQRPRLWKARVLHFQGTKSVRQEDRNSPLAEPRRGHRDATRLYQSANVRPPNKVLDRLEPAKQAVYRVAKADASYWLGLLSFDVGKFEVARDWLEERTLKVAPEGPWAAGARYNLARVYESLGELDRAIALLESHPDEPQHHGNVLRARLLTRQLNAEQEPADSGE